MNNNNDITYQCSLPCGVTRCHNFLLRVSNFTMLFDVQSTLFTRNEQFKKWPTIFYVWVGN